jgi:hypothetical protein
MPALTDKRTYFGKAIGRWLGRSYAPGVESHVPVVQSFGAPRIGKLTDVLDGIALSATEPTEITEIDFYGVDPLEGNLPRQLILEIVKAGAPQNVSVTILGNAGWGEQIEETVSVVTVNALPAYGLPGNNYPYSAFVNAPPGYDLISTTTKHDWMIVKSVRVNDPVVGGVLYVGRNNTFGLKYPIIGMNDTDSPYWYTDKAAFVLQELAGVPITESAAQMRLTTSVGRVIPGTYYPEGEGDPRGYYQPFEPLVDGPPGEGGLVGFLLIYIPSRIDSVRSVLPHMFIESKGNFDVLPNRRANE